MRDIERESTYTVTGKDATANKQTKLPSLSGGRSGIANIDELVVVGKYT